MLSRVSGRPDVFYITLSQLQKSGGILRKGPLEIAPELVVEVISDSETQQRVDDKMLDYAALGVPEVWRVWLDSRTVEVLRGTPAGYVPVAAYTEAQTLASVVFPDLMLAVADVFAA